MNIGALQERNTDELALKWRKRKEEKKNAFKLDFDRIKTVPVELWSVADVLLWLKTQNLQVLQHTFNRHDVDGPTLLALSSAQLDAMGIKALKYRKTLLHQAQTVLRSPYALESNKTVRQHWSVLKPLKDNPVSQPSGQPAVNLADGEYDERKASESFQEAVQAWRKAPPNSLAFTTDSAEWKNPFA